MPIITAGFGFMMLIAGRPAYAVFVGGVAFLVGSYLSGRMSLAPSTWNSLVTPILIAIMGGLGAILARRWAARVAGFFAGGYLVYALPKLFGASPGWPIEIAFAAVGLICFILLIVVFDAFLMFLSTLTAVTMILSSARLGSLDPLILFLILVVFGVIAQYLIYEYGTPSPD